jgi:hypothetical protein
VDPSTLATLAIKDLSANPTSLLSELVIKENTLAYGLYKFQFQVIATFNGNSQISSNLAETYFQIIPTGLVVIAISNGVSSVWIGTNQEFILQPSVFSIDFDNIVQPSQLNFTYYCKTVNLTDLNTINSQGNSIDLLTYTNNQTLVMDRNLNCFGKNSNFFVHKKIVKKNRIFFVLFVNR